MADDRQTDESGSNSELSDLLYCVHSCDEKMPPIPKTPFKVYLVFAVVALDGGTGMWETLQFSKKDNNWMPFSTILGDPCVITHWAELPSKPGKDRHGPRWSEEKQVAV